MTITISHDNLFEILSWLPAKAIQRFKCSSKFFSEIVEDTYFTSKQFQKALTKDDECFFIQQKYSNYNKLHLLQGEELSCGVPKVALEFLSNSASIIASSNGLILGRSRSYDVVSDDLFICNPATNYYLQIPTDNSVIDANLNNSVLQCNSSDCKVYLFYDPYRWSSYLACKVYLQNEDTWSENGTHFFAGQRSLRFDNAVDYNGFIHLISNCSAYLAKGSPYYRPYIVFYNYEDGKSGFLRLPKEARRGSDDESCDMRIFKWGKVNGSTQSICLVRLRKKVFSVWVLTNYESASWKRILKVRVKGMGLSEQDPFVTGFTVLNGDTLVFSTEKKVYSYGLTDKRYMVLEEICEHACESHIMSFVSYSNTLRSCGVGAETLPCAVTNHLDKEFAATTQLSQV